MVSFLVFSFLLCLQIGATVSYEVEHETYFENYEPSKAEFINSGRLEKDEEVDVSTMMEVNEQLDMHRSQRSKISKAQKQGAGDETRTIRVYFHILSDSTGVGNIPDGVVEKQLQVVNEAFSGITNSLYSECSEAGTGNLLFTYEPFSDSSFRFELVEINHIVDDNLFDLDTSSDEVASLLRKGTCSDLNIYTGSTKFLGWSSFPWNCPTNGDIDDPRQRDGVFLQYTVLPDQGFSSFDQGDTLIHEIGHWLGLYHTFQGACAEEGGDDVQDTSRELSPALGCPVGRNSCGDDGLDPIHSFMDYSDDCCLYRFSDGQIERMIDNAEVYRSVYPDTSSSPQISTSSSSTVQTTINDVTETPEFSADISSSTTETYSISPSSSPEISTSSNSSVQTAINDVSETPELSVEISSSTTVMTTALCNVSNSHFIGDGFCDRHSDYNSEQCGYDGGDCCVESCIPYPELGEKHLCVSVFECIDPLYNPKESNDDLMSNTTITIINVTNMATDMGDILFSDEGCGDSTLMTKVVKSFIRLMSFKN